MRSLVLSGTVASEVAHLVTVVTLDVLTAATVGAFPRDVARLPTAKRQKFDSSESSQAQRVES